MSITQRSLCKYFSIRAISSTFIVHLYWYQEKTTRNVFQQKQTIWHISCRLYLVARFHHAINKEIKIIISEGVGDGIGLLGQKFELPRIWFGFLFVWKMNVCIFCNDMKSVTRNWAQNVTSFWHIIKLEFKF